MSTRPKSNPHCPQSSRRAQLHATIARLHEDLARIHGTLADLQNELADLEESEEGTEDPCQPTSRSSSSRSKDSYSPSGKQRKKRRSTSASSSRGPGLQEGDRVRITIADQYCGRVGTVKDKRGDLFWNIELDPPPGSRRTQFIYKMSTSVERLE